MIGIYAIIHTSGKAYVGQSINVESRFYGHKRRLTKGTHHCVRLQRAWNKYGPSQFEFKPLLSCAKADLNYFEEYMFKEYELYNSLLQAGTGNYPRKIGASHSAETKAKIKIAVRQAKEKQRLAGFDFSKTQDHKQKISASVRNSRKSKSVIATNKTGEILNFDTMKDASSFLNVSLQTIWNCVNGRQMQTKGWVIRFC